MLGWFSSDEAKFFFAFLQETLDARNRDLVLNAKRWNTTKNGAVLEDTSDILRGQLITLEMIIGLPEQLRAGVKKEIATLVDAANKESK